jgi:hypothetical protein
VGYSARYHAASLAAVFLALAIGILIGVGLGGTVDSATEDLQDSLKSDLADSRGQVESLQGELSRERDFAQAAYAGLVGDLLRGHRVAVVALGGLPGELDGDIDAVVGDENPTGARLSEFAVVREPPDSDALRDILDRPRYADGGSRLSAFAEDAGRALVKGGALFDRMRDPLLERVSGEPGAVDAVIVVRQRPDDLGPARANATEQLEDGLLNGIERVPGVALVGVERSDADGSQIGFYDSHGLTATVDSIDLTSGRVALAYALRGAEGNFGVKETADRLLPAFRQGAGGRGGP